MTDQVKTDEKDPLEPLKATIRAYLVGKDLSKTVAHVAFHELYVAPVPPVMQFSLAWQGVMREFAAEVESAKTDDQAATEPAKTEPPKEEKPLATDGEGAKV